MPEAGCAESMQLLNAIFLTPLIFNDGHEIRERLAAGDSVVDVVDELGRKFGSEEMAATVKRVVGNWPEHHLEAVARVVEWALWKLDTPDRIMIGFKGDAEHPETVTRFELRDHDLLIEFAHPPFAQAQAPAA